MVALKPSEAKNHSGAENMLGIKKSKKKKSKKINTEESVQGRESYLIESWQKNCYILWPSWAQQSEQEKAQEE